MKSSGKDAVNTARKPVRLRLIALLAVGGILIGGACAFYALWLRLPVGEGPAGPSVPSDSFAKLWSERPTVLLALGDSVTAGYGAVPGKTYVDMLASNPPDDFEDMQGRALEKVFPRLRTINVAVSGSDSIQHFEK